MDPGYFEGVKKVLHFGTVQKELVDPYCTVSFAGKKGKTHVIWNEQDPEWNHQVNLGIRVSCCDSLWPVAGWWWRPGVVCNGAFKGFLGSGRFGVCTQP